MASGSGIVNRIQRHKAQGAGHREDSLERLASGAYVVARGIGYGVRDSACGARNKAILDFGILILE